MDDVVQQLSDMQDKTVYNNKRFCDLAYQKRELKQKEFYKCIFENCKFLESIFSQCIFEDCIFKNSDLSLVVVKQSSFFGVSFKESKLVGVNWTNSGKPFTADFYTCTLDYSIYIGMNLRKVKMISCSIKDADFAEADLANASFVGSDLQGARFLNTNLTQTDFTDAKNYSIDPRCNKLKKTQFSLPEAISLLKYFDIVIK